MPTYENAVFDTLMEAATGAVMQCAMGNGSQSIMVGAAHDAIEAAGKVAMLGSAKQDAAAQEKAALEYNDFFMRLGPVLIAARAAVEDAEASVVADARAKEAASQAWLFAFVAQLNAKVTLDILRRVIERGGRSADEEEQ